jgi:hypothetical protein
MCGLLFWSEQHFGFTIRGIPPLKKASPALLFVRSSCVKAAAAAAAAAL